MQIIILSKHYHPYSDNDVITKEEKPLKRFVVLFFFNNVCLNTQMCSNHAK